RIERLERPTDASGAVEPEAPMAFDQQADLRPDRVSNGGDACECLCELLPADRQAGRSKRVELERLVTDRHRLRGALAEVVCGLCAEVPGVRVDAGAVPNATAEQRVNGDVEALPEDVPQRHLDSAGCGAHNRSAVPVAASRQHVGGFSDAARVPADQPARHVLDGALDSMLTSLDRAFAVADEL